MGVTDQFLKANRYLSQELRYHLDPDNAAEFRQLLNRCGYKRFETAVALIKLRGYALAEVRHKQLLTAIAGLMPHKEDLGTKYRSAAAAAGVERHRELNEDMKIKMALDRCVHGKRQVTCEACADEADVPF